MMYYHMEIFKKVDIIVTPTTGYASSLFLFLYCFFYLSLCLLPIIETRNLNQRPNQVLACILQKQGRIGCIVKTNRYFTHWAVSTNISCFQPISDVMITMIAIITTFLHSAFMLSNWLFRISLCYAFGRFNKYLMFSTDIWRSDNHDRNYYRIFALYFHVVELAILDFSIPSWELWTSACFGPAHPSRLWNWINELFVEPCMPCF